MKRHTCKAPGCGKAFSRPSHLQRHALNHSDTQLVCERCKAYFKRLDLLGVSPTDSHSGFALFDFSSFHQVRGQSSTDMSIQERHKARHVFRDKRAGGVGLGILETKSKHFRAASVCASSSVPSPTQASHFPKSRCQISPPVTEPQNAYPSRKTSNLSDSFCFLSHDPDEHWSSPHELPVPNISTEYLNVGLNYLNSSQIANVLMEQSTGVYEIGSMYHDIRFDLAHLNVTGLAQLPDYRPSENQALSEVTVQSSNIRGVNFYPLFHQQEMMTPLSKTRPNPPSRVSLMYHNIR